MTPECRAELDRIETFLMRRDIASAELATILSALRGNDANICESKTEPYPKEATMTVRMEAFPRLCQVRELYLAVTGTCWAFHFGTLPTSFQKAVLKQAGEHFTDHVVGALAVLGWNTHGELITKPTT